MSAAGRVLGTFHRTRGSREGDSPH
jgi:hypothetical protein